MTTTNGLPRYLLGSGFYDGAGSGSRWFLENLWYPNVMSMAGTEWAPERVAIIAVGGSKVDVRESALPLTVVELGGNLGHVHQLIGKSLPAKSHSFCGWSSAILTLAMMAYTDECDFIFLEQDALAFGPWVKQLYEEMRSWGKSMMFGHSKVMPCAQSLFIIKHGFIPTFVRAYLELGADSLRPGRITNSSLPEHKFIELEKGIHSKLVEHIGRFSFGYDRDRPINYDDAVWYGQKFTRAELVEVDRRGLIAIDSFPDGVERFTND